MGDDKLQRALLCVSSQQGVSTDMQLLAGLVSDVLMSRRGSKSYSQALDLITQITEDARLASFVREPRS